MCTIVSNSTHFIYDKQASNVLTSQLSNVNIIFQIFMPTRSFNGRYGMHVGGDHKVMFGISSCFRSLLESLQGKHGQASIGGPVVG